MFSYEASFSWVFYLSIEISIKSCTSIKSYTSILSQFSVKSYTLLLPVTLTWLFTLVLFLFFSRETMLCLITQDLNLNSSQNIWIIRQFGLYIQHDNIIRTKWDGLVFSDLGVNRALKAHLAMHVGHLNYQITLPNSPFASTKWSFLTKFFHISRTINYNYWSLDNESSHTEQQVSEVT